MPSDKICSETWPRPGLDGYSTPEFSRGRPAGRRGALDAGAMAAHLLAAPGIGPSPTNPAAVRSPRGRGVVVKPGARIKFPWRLSIGDHSWIGEDAWIDNLAPVAIGADCCLSQGAYLCTGSHDWSRPSFDLLTKPIVVHDGAWIAARAVVGPGVTVGEGAVLCLGSTATRDLTPGRSISACRRDRLPSGGPGTSSDSGARCGNVTERSLPAR